MHIDPLCRDARLTRVREPGSANESRGPLPVTIRLDDHRGVVAELERHPLARGPGPDSPSDIGRTRERDHRYVTVVDQGLADHRSASRDNVHPARWKAALLGQEAEQGHR